MLRDLGRRKRLAVSLATAVIAVAGGLLTVPSQAAPLPGGTMFNALDGNLAAAQGETDWETYKVNPAPPQFSKLDDNSIRLKETDNYYQGGPKHDDPCPTVKISTSGLPSAKDDLTEFYVFNETFGQNNFLYLAWERYLDKESTASAHMGFEFNQATTACSTNNPANVPRSAGDILILFDVEGGGGDPQLRIMRWLTAASGAMASQCESKSTLPCWGNNQNLSQAGFAQGSTNTAPPTITGIIGDELKFSRQFGEAAINLTAAEVFEPGTCMNFGNAILASRSSGNSFNSGLDDFVGPLDVTINNCGTVRITKTDDATPANLLSGVTFSAYKSDGDSKFDPPGAPNFDEPGDAFVASCTTGNGMNGTTAGVCTIQNLFQGDYWIVEGTVPNGYTGSEPVLSTVSAGTTVSVTRVNPRKHKVIVLVCHEGTNTLLQSQVVRGTSPNTEQLASLASVPQGLSVTQQELCGLPGASFGNLDHGTQNLTVNISH